MAINFYSAINLNQNDIEQLIPHKVSSAPSSPSPVSGQMYYNTTANTLHYHDGTNFIQVANHADIGSGAMSAFIIEDDDGTEVSISNAEEIKFIGSGLTTNFTDTSTGSDGDPFDLTFTIDAAQTGITSILATDLKIGEDDQTKIDFETADQIHFYAANAEQVYVADGIFGPQTDSDVDLGSTGVRWKDAFVDSMTVTGEMQCATLDIGGTNVTSTAAELNILDGVTSTAAELNILDGVTSTTAELNILDGVTSSTAELNALDGITAVVGELNALDIGSTAVGTAVASKAVILDSNKDYTGIRNFTITGDLVVGGETTTVNVTTTTTANGVVFEGTSADGVDATLKSVVAGSNKTYTLPNVTGHVALFAADPGTTTISSTPAELNILDGVTSTAAELNILDGVTSTAAELNILDGVTATAAEINLIDGGTSRTTNAVADGDGILHNNGGTMEMTKVETFATYFGTEVASQRQVVADIDVSSLTGNKRVTITHDLGTADISVQLYDKTTGDQVFAETARTTNNMTSTSTSVITVDFGTDPPNDLRAVITSLSSAAASSSVAYA